MIKFVEARLNEMATSYHPKKNGGKYPMWIRVEFTDGEHNPPHAHLYKPDQKPSKNSLITKFIISEQPPKKAADIEVMKGKPPVPSKYAELIIHWARDKRKPKVSNWVALHIDWEGLEDTFK